MGLGSRIREIREAQSLSQAQLAERVGSGQSTISQLEQGDRNPSYKTLRSLATALDVSVSYLLGEAEFETIDPEEEVLFREYRGLSEGARRQLRDYARFLQKTRLQAEAPEEDP